MTTFLKYAAIPILILIVAVAYWFLSYEPAGTVMLFLFGIAMGVMEWVLVPTFGDVGPTAPVDADWHEHKTCRFPLGARKGRTLRLPWRQSRQRSVRLTGTNAVLAFPLGVCCPQTQVARTGTSPRSAARKEVATQRWLRR